VPGAGKTLVGLNVATRHGSRDDAAHAVFLSGNGPLVAVLREALARDELERRKKEKVSALFEKGLLAIHAGAAAGVEDGQPDHLVTAVAHDDVIGPKLAIGCLSARLEVDAHHVRGFVIRAVHRTMRGLEHRGDQVEKIAWLKRGHGGRLPHAASTSW